MEKNNQSILDFKSDLDKYYDKIVSFSDDVVSFANNIDWKDIQQIVKDLDNLSNEILESKPVWYNVFMRDFHKIILLIQDLRWEFKSRNWIEDNKEDFPIRLDYLEQIWYKKLDEFEENVDSKLEWDDITVLLNDIPYKWDSKNEKLDNEYVNLVKILDEARNTNFDIIYIDWNIDFSDSEMTDTKQLLLNKISELSILWKTVILMWVPKDLNEMWKVRANIALNWWTHTIPVVKAPQYCTFSKEYNTLRKIVNNDEYLKNTKWRMWNYLNSSLVDINIVDLVHLIMNPLKIKSYSPINEPVKKSECDISTDRENLWRAYRWPEQFNSLNYNWTQDLKNLSWKILIIWSTKKSIINGKHDILAIWEWENQQLRAWAFLVADWILQSPLNK